MGWDEAALRRAATRGRGTDRLTQDTPVMPDVWVAFGQSGTGRVDLLLTPHHRADPAELAFAVREGLDEEARAAARVSHSARHVAARLTLEEVVRIVLPLSAWGTRVRSKVTAARVTEELPRLTAALGGEERTGTSGPVELDDITWLAWLLGGLLTMRPSASEAEVAQDDEGRLARAGLELALGSLRDAPGDRPIVWLVTRNRPATKTVSTSRMTVKADAAVRLFDIDCSGLAWAVIDTGIDARHPAFRLRTAKGQRHANAFRAGANNTCVVKTYDLTRLRTAQTAALDGTVPDDPAVRLMLDQHADELRAMGEHLVQQRPLDWSRLAPLLEIRPDAYEPPTDDHGTHIAGILAGQWDDAADGPLLGLCPGLSLYDLRVFDPTGASDEFTVSAALQFVDHLNGYGRAITVAGANVSLSVPYEVDVFGCGQTPVCVEADRLVAGGVVVVAAAGNRGADRYLVAGEDVQGFRLISLTDPGNAQDVITVGSAHARNPHGYGVSYFSSRGPTGDGRAKPDLVAPGEKIAGPAIGGRLETMDGTSQAAAHVSGAAALLLARHRELVGQPRRVKQVLMASATDLGRERPFQGAGLVDALRATQAI